ncbi:hypothetical protein Ancab_034243 [Ancistrocladus abbreviatus]
MEILGGLAATWKTIYVPNHVLVIIDAQPVELGIPIKAYYAVEEVKEVWNTCSEISCDVIFHNLQVSGKLAALKELSRDPVITVHTLVLDFCLLLRSPVLFWFFAAR